MAEEGGVKMFTWVKGNAYALVATLYENNITLNQAAAAYFQDVRWVMIGLDHDAKRLAIKPITKREIDLKLVALEQLHKISLGKGYARISNKQTMEEISRLIDQPLHAQKYDGVYDEQEGLLIVDLNGEAMKG